MCIRDRAYSDGTAIDSSTLVKLPDGERDLKDLYEAATPGIHDPGDIDFEVPTVQYNGAAITNATAAVNRYLQFTTDESGRICHLENASTTPAANSYATLLTLVPGIRTARRAAMERAYNARMTKAAEHMTILRINDWIEKVVGEEMDPVTLEHHEEAAKCLNGILKSILDLNSYLKGFLIETLEHVNGSFFTSEIRDHLKMTGTMADSMDKYISALKDLKNAIDREDEKDEYPDDYQFILDRINELGLRKTDLIRLTEKINSYGITDLPDWIKNGISEIQLSYISAGYLYSGRYC